MLGRIYFALVSGIASRSLLPTYSNALLDGDWKAAYSAVASIADDNDRSQPDGDLRLIALADALSLRDLDEEAEQSYARAQRACRRGDDQIRMISCRNAGWQALKRDRFGLARNCFTRIVRDEAASAEQATEACIGLALVDYRLGHQGTAVQALDYAMGFAEHLTDPLWAEVVALLIDDIEIQTAIRCSGALSDHVFWQSARVTSGYRPPLATLDDGAPAAVVGSGLRAGMPAALNGRVHGTAPVPKVMQRHRDYLEWLAQTGVGDDVAADRLTRLLDDMRHGGSASLLPEMQLSALLAALAGGYAAMAERLHYAVGRRDAGMSAIHSHLDFMYADAKVAALRGKTLNALTLYSNYSQGALHCLRTEVLAMHSLDPRFDRAVSTRCDDVIGRLPPKYRPAYRYIVDNIAHSTLATREVAAYIDVTERSLQIVFKRSLGLSPSALIRQLRLQGIRRELQDESHVVPSVLDTANRWGVTSRSALIKSYRKQFNESPSETING
ncbi:helix-turn-helix transcriptional regulator [Robbsia sp. KACC 23696]|uniref:helix-turn-helix transcriptional regulator n=1 Tax=Robbsia sp. KACC 23696 TaxID=3149231 RepID=UPI00325B6E5E